MTHSAHRTLVVTALLVAALAAFAAPNHRASAGPAPTPTCTDPRPGGQTYTATAFLTSPGTLIGTPGRDILVGSTGADVIKGLGGNDLICTGSGDDIVDAGPGNDVVTTYDQVGPGLAQIQGGNGNDTIFVQGDGHGGSGNDVLEGNFGTLWGDAGDDTLYEVTGNAVYGGSGNDDVRGVSVDVADGGSGDDYVHGARPFTTLRGGSGDDKLVNENTPSVDRLDGGSGRDECTPFGAQNRSCEILT